MSKSINKTTNKRPTADEIANYLRISKTKVYNIRNRKKKPLSGKVPLTKNTDLIESITEIVKQEGFSNLRMRNI